MSKSKATAVATKPTRKAAATKPAGKPSRSRKPEPQPEPVVDRAAAISAGMAELKDVREKARAKRNGTPAKPLIFSEWLKALLSGKPFDAEAMARKYPEIKESS